MSLLFSLSESLPHSSLDFMYGKSILPNLFRIFFSCYLNFSFKLNCTSSSGEEEEKGREKLSLREKHWKNGKRKHWKNGKRRRAFNATRIIFRNRWSKIATSDTKIADSIQVSQPELRLSLSLSLSHRFASYSPSLQVQVTWNGSSHAIIFNLEKKFDIPQVSTRIICLSLLFSFVIFLLANVYIRSNEKGKIRERERKKERKRTHIYWYWHVSRVSRNANVQLIPCVFCQSRKRDSSVAKKKDVTFTQFVFYSMDLRETETGLSLSFWIL